MYCLGPGVVLASWPEHNGCGKGGEEDLRAAAVVGSDACSACVGFPTVNAGVYPRDFPRISEPVRIMGTVVQQPLVCRPKGLSHRCCGSIDLRS
jgi:hypothetical protein